MSAKLRCPKCKHPLDIGDSVDVVCDNGSATEVACSCFECQATFSAWIDHKRGWADADGDPDDLTVAKGGAS